MSSKSFNRLRIEKLKEISEITTSPINTGRPMFEPESMSMADAELKPEEERSQGRFVVQEHNATRLHWDFRLEMDGVLKSWAIPKEPPVSTGVRRLAVAVEDHDLDYIDFEGIIPEGEYGAGTVEIWDKGSYKMESKKPDKMVFELRGSKMKGRYVLLHFTDKAENWLLFKTKNT